MHAPTQLHVAGGVTRNLIPTKSGALSVAAEFGSSPRGGATYRIKSATRRRPLSVAVGSFSAPRMWTPTWSAPRRGERPAWPGSVRRFPKPQLHQ